MSQYILEHFVANLINLMIWYVIGFVIFRPSWSARAAGLMILLIASFAYIGMFLGPTPPSAETIIWTVVTSAIGLGLGYYFAPKARRLRMSEQEMANRLRAMIDDPATSEEHREQACQRLENLSKFNKTHSNSTMT